MFENGYRFIENITQMNVLFTRSAFKVALKSVW